MQQPHHRASESYGLGQSGCTSGRVARDPAIGLQGQNIAYPSDADEAPVEFGEDERFTGRGGRTWAPPELEEEPGVASDLPEGKPEP